MLIGSSALLVAAGIDAGELTGAAERLSADGKTPLLVATLRSLGLQVAMITGECPCSRPHRRPYPTDMSRMRMSSRVQAM